MDAVRGYAEQTKSPVVAVCAAIEAEIASLDDADKAEFTTVWAWKSRAWTA